MTTDITELAQREKFEAWAEEVGALPWGILKKHRNQDGSYSGPHYTYMWKAWQAASAELAEALEKAQTINAASEKLVRCKGRYHSEQNYRALATLFGVTTPDLPPVDGESRTITLKLPQAVSAGGQGYQEQVERILTAAGIKWEAE